MQIQRQENKIKVDQTVGLSGSQQQQKKRQCVRDFIEKLERSWSLWKPRRRRLDINMKVN